jgi:hypothetical protein
MRGKSPQFTTPQPNNQLDNPLLLVQRLLEIKQLQLRNQQIQDQLEQEQRQRQAQQLPVPAPAPLPPTPDLLFTLNTAYADAVAHESRRPAVSPVTPAQSDVWGSARRTEGRWNGLLWVGLTEDQKHAFLFAYADAVAYESALVTHSAEEQDNRASLFWPTKYSYSKVRELLDTFYATKENEKIDISSAILLLALRDRGTDESVIQKAVEEMGGAKFPSRWKSLTNGTTKVTRRDGDNFYVETILPDAAKQAGCFNLAELRKQGDVFTGTNRESCVCQYTKPGLGGPVTETTRYTLETTVEISEVTPTRIEGRSLMPPKDTRIDCEKGQYSKPASEWRPFTWIPE